MRTKCALILAILFLFCGSLFAGKAAVPFNPKAEIYEPHQRAFIGWNGEEEIMTVSADMRASQKTKVLEIMPLPSKPEIRTVELDLFRETASLISKKLQEVPHTREEEANMVRPDLGGLLIFYGQVGVQEISLAQATDRERFVNWANSYLRSGADDAPVIPDAMLDLIESLIKDGYTWFVFDVITLEPQLTTIEPIQYRFRTDELYFPLRASSTELGYTRIDVQVLTPKRLKEFPGINTSRVALLHEPVELTSAELLKLAPEIDDLLGEPASCLLRNWQLQGPLNGFYQDLLAK